VKGISKTSTVWNTWIDVPQVASEILQASVSVERNLKGSLKSFLYKDEAVFVYYQFVNGDIRMYRFVPKNAAYGLWINPLIMNPETGKNSLPVKRIMFRCSNTAMMKDDISIEWKQIKFLNVDAKAADPLFAFFGINPEQSPVQIQTSINNLDGIVSYWSLPDESKILSDSGNRILQLFPEAYSVTYEFSLDSLKPRDTTDKLMIRTGVWAKSGTGSKAVYVISVEKDGESLLWQAVDIQNFIYEASAMNYITNFALLDHEILRKHGLILKVYAWNTGEKMIELDDFSVRIETW